MSATHYVIVRRDLPIGFLAAQVVHAAGESSNGKILAGTNAVVLSASDESELRAIGRALNLAGVPNVQIHEPDAPYCGQMTAIGVCPVTDRRVVKPILSALPLLGKERVVAA